MGSSGAGGQNQGSTSASELDSGSSNQGSGSNNQNFGSSEQLSGSGSSGTSNQNPNGSNNQNGSIQSSGSFTSPDSTNGSSSTTDDAISSSQGPSSSNVDDDDRVDIPSDANAGSTQKYKVLPGSLYQCPQPGFYPYETNCREFYVCLEVLPGILFAEQLYRCPSRYLFDEDTRRCQREEKVNCRKFSFNAAAANFAKENVLVVLERFLEPFFATPLNYRAAQTIYPRG